MVEFMRTTTNERQHFYALTHDVALLNAYRMNGRRWSLEGTT
jgi:hypothetical protein